MVPSASKAPREEAASSALGNAPPSHSSSAPDFSGSHSSSFPPTLRSLSQSLPPHPWNKPSERVLRLEREVSFLFLGFSETTR